MRQVKSVAVVLLSMLFFVLCLTGCKSMDPAKNNTELTTLRVWHTWNGEDKDLRDYYDRAVARYMADNPGVKIVTEEQDGENYKKKLSASLSENTSDVDVFYWWGANSAKDLVKNRKVLALDRYITADINQRMTGSAEHFTFDGKTYSVPMFAGHTSLYCNKELFEKADAEIPKTYEQLKEAVVKLKGLTGVIPIAVGAKDSNEAAAFYEALAAHDVGGQGIMDMLTGMSDFSNKGFENAALKTAELRRMGAFGSNPLEQSGEEADTAFITGKAAMRIMDSREASKLLSDSASTVSRDKIIETAFPSAGKNTDDNVYSGGFVESFWVNSNTKDPDQAAKFCLYINEEMGKASQKTGNGISGWSDDMSEVNMTGLLGQLMDNIKKGAKGILSWDSMFDDKTGVAHKQAAQTLFSANPDTGAFIDMHNRALGSVR